MGPGDVMLAMVVIGLPTMMIMLIADRYFKHREKRFEIEALRQALAARISRKPASTSDQAA